MSALYRVTGQRQTQDLSPSGGFLEVMEVTAELVTSRTAFTIRVPLDRFTVDEVREQLDERARELEAVSQL